MSSVVIFGSGDYARIAAVYLGEDSPHEVVAFTVDAERMEGQELMGRPVIPFEELTDRFPPEDYEMLVAVAYSGVNKARAKIFERCKELGYDCISYVSSRATYGARQGRREQPSSSTRTPCSRSSRSATTAWSGAEITSGTTRRSGRIASSPRTS